MGKLYISVVTALFLVQLTSQNGMAQQVRDSAFCRDVVNNVCIGLIPDGATVRIAQLKLIDGSPAVYFWGNLRNPSGNAVGFYFTRTGDCSQHLDIDSDEKASKLLSYRDKISGFLSNVTIGEIWNSLGISEVSIKAKDIKLNVVTIPRANRFRISDYRYAECAGELSARLIDSRGNPLPGENEMLTIKIH